MIEFGNWRLVQRDKLNLALQHRHVSDRSNGKGDGTLKWHDTGNYFQSVYGGVMFALRQEMRDAVGDADERMTMEGYLTKVETIVVDFKEWLSGQRMAAQ